MHMNTHACTFAALNMRIKSIHQSINQWINQSIPKLITDQIIT
jgi:hypothetical protein